MLSENIANIKLDITAISIEVIMNQQIIRCHNQSVHKILHH